MHSMKRHFAAATALAFVLAALAGSALAAPPSSPPGQEKKAEPAPAATPAPAPAATEKKAEKPGKAEKAQKAESKSSGVNSTTAGVKPSSTTSKNQKTTAGASPDASKRYGNGKTAAQIATSRGAPGSTEIYGPGNSQPHKVCKKVNANGKEVWVDVHAVKSYSANQCAPSPASSSTSKTTACPTTSTTVVGVLHNGKLKTNEKSAHFKKHEDAAQTQTTVVQGNCANSTTTSTTLSSSSQTSQTSQTSSATAAAPAAGSAPAAGGVAGVEATASAPAAEAGGVAGAFAEVGNIASGTLPFTGLPLWVVVLIALAVIAIGITLYRRSRPMTTRDVV